MPRVVQTGASILEEFATAYDKAGASCNVVAPLAAKWCYPDGSDASGPSVTFSGTLNTLGGYALSATAPSTPGDYRICGYGWDDTGRKVYMRTDVLTVTASGYIPTAAVTLTNLASIFGANIQNGVNVANAAGSTVTQLFFASSASNGLPQLQDLGDDYYTTLGGHLGLVYTLNQQSTGYSWTISAGGPLFGTYAPNGGTPSGNLTLSALLSLVKAKTDLIGTNAGDSPNQQTAQATIATNLDAKISSISAPTLSDEQITAIAADVAAALDLSAIESALTASPIVVRRLIDATGLLVLNAGADYSAAKGCAILFGVPAGYTDLSGLTPLLQITHYTGIAGETADPPDLSIPGTVLTGSYSINGQTYSRVLQFELTALQTASLPHRRAGYYVYHVRAVKSSPPLNLAVVSESPCLVQW